MSDPVTVLSTVPLGARVVVRHLIEGGERATDSVGPLVGRDSTSLTVETRRGSVRIALADIVAGKPIPAAAVRWRVASFLQRARVAVLDLHVLAPEDPDGETTAAESGGPACRTIELIERLEARGIPVFVLTEETDPSPPKLEAVGLGRLVAHLIESGPATPTEQAYAAAHAEIERRLGRTVGRGEVHFTDDRPANVEAARLFGWQARVFTLP